MSNDIHAAFKESWEDYPSQDNEGYVPDRAGYKCGFFEGARWQKEKSPEAWQSAEKDVEIIGLKNELAQVSKWLKEARDKK